MKRRFILVFLVCALVSIVPAAASARAPHRLSSLAGRYSCRFSSSSGYIPPGLNAGVDVSGVFGLLINHRGAITESHAMLSVGDGGAGPVTCGYKDGIGSLGFAANGTDSLELGYQEDAQNSPLCPDPNVFLLFTPVNKGMVFVYSSQSGFIGGGVCTKGNATPKGGSYACQYQVPNKGAAVGAVVFTPVLSKAASGFVSIVETQAFSPSQLCPFVGAGTYTYSPKDGTGSWSASLNPPPAPWCLNSGLFGKVSFVNKGGAFQIAGAGIINPVCMAKTRPRSTK